MEFPDILLGIFFNIRNCKFTIYSQGAISKCGMGGGDDVRE
jgi:hypothetical protein